MNLNQQQIGCIDCNDPVVLCVASPGSGKTTTLTRAVERRIQDGVHPKNIMAITFTRYAAGQLRAKIEESNRDAAQCAIGTFHGICYDIIRSNWRQLGYSCESIAVYDQEDQENLLRECEILSRHKANKGDMKRALGMLATTGHRRYDDEGTHVTPIIDRYLRVLKTHDAVDYDVINSLAIECLGDDSKSQWTDVFVDECQDLNLAQFIILKRLGANRIFLVGDPDQLIYGWRGASIHVMQRQLTKEMPATIHRLEVNYRSSRAVIESAARLIARNDIRIEKDMVPDAGATAGVVDVIHESDLVPEICHAASTEQSIAVLSRTRRSRDIIASDLVCLGMEPNIVGSRGRIMERKDVRAAFAYLVWPWLPTNPSVMTKVMQSEGGAEIVIERMKAEAKSSGKSCFDVMLSKPTPIADMYREMEGKSLTERFITLAPRIRTLDKADLSEITAMITAFVRSTPKKDRTGDILLSWINQRDAQDEVATTPGVYCMTIHAAKGLEFDTVFIVDADDGTIPMRRHFDNQVEMEEERRLFFVAMTRARERLVISHGERPSRFITESGLTPCESQHQ